MRRRATGSRALRASAEAVVVLALLWLPLPSEAVSTGTPPALVDSLGGPGHAEMYPSGLEVAPDGTIVVADTGNNLVKKYNPDGSLVWSLGGFGMGTNKFKDPRDIGVDSSGNVYVADTANSRIVKLSPDGVWITSWKGPSSDRVGSPIGLTVTGDLIYVADGSRLKVRVFNTVGAQIRTFGGAGSCVFSNIRDVDADSDGNVYIANYKNNNILKMTAVGACIKTWGTKGTGNGQFKNPYGVRVATDPVLGTEAVYVADSNNNRIQEFTTDGDFVAKFGGFGDFDQPGTFSGLRRVAVAPDGGLWGADLWGWDLEHADRQATGYSFAGSIPAVPAKPPLTDTEVFNEVRGIGFDASGVIHAVDTVNQRIVRMDSSGSIINACGKRGWEVGAFNWPRGVAVDHTTSDVWIADTKQSRLQIVRPDCASVAKLGSAGSGTANFNWPHSIAIRQSDRTAWIADTKNNRIDIWDVATKTVIATWGAKGSGDGQFNSPQGISVDPVSDHIWVADANNNRIVEIAADSGGTNISFVRSIGGFNKPAGVAADSQGRIYVADSANWRVVVLQASDGSVIATFNDGFYRPENVAVDPNDRLIVSDTYNDRIQVYAYA